MDILIKNCNLVSMDEQKERCQNNIDIYIKDNVINKIDKNIPIEQAEDIKIIDATNRYVMPGLINTHSHIPMSIFRETLEGYSLQEWLSNKIWPMEDKLTAEDIYYATLLSCIEMIRTGTTTINDMYTETESIIKAAVETGIRIQTTRTLMSLGNDGEERLKELENIINKYNNKNENITFNIGIHGLYTSNETYIQECIKFANKYNLPIHMHFCENAQEVEDIENEYGVKPTQVLEKYFNNNHTILAHAVELEDSDIEILAKMDNIYISHCPVSNLKLGCGIANTKKMVEENINISLGTDGQGSGSNLDMFENMKFTALLQKGANKNPKALFAYEVLKMSTINGAKALGLERKIGSIQEGKQADILILNMNNEITQPINDIVSNIVYNVKGTNVETTIINGKIVMENRKLNDINEITIYEKCTEIIERIKG